jgi:gamma-glutamyltranspeptidase/glutathione hydrolase
MKSRQRVLAGTLIVAAFVLAGRAVARDPPDEPHCVLATVNPQATDAGLDAYREGGNAVDAAIAAALTLGVVDPYNSGIGGGCFILVRCPDGNLVAIDGRETAPAAATADMYVRDGTVQPDLSRIGPLAVGVPGALAAYQLALQTVGQLALPDLLRPAAAIAEQGFSVNPLLATNLKNKADLLRRYPGSRAVLLRGDGEPWQAGEVLRQGDLARTYRAVADHGIDWFYRGPFAEQVESWMAVHGGLLTSDDFARYRPLAREPIVSTYRGYRVIGFPPPSSGGIHVAQILNTLEAFDLSERRRRDPVRASHLVVEAMKLAFADRAYWLGDADFVKVPRGLVEKAYARRLADRIDPDRSSPVPSQGDPVDVKEGYFGRHTTHIAAADSEGYWVAITATINTQFGSKVIVPGTGVILNNEMDDFSSQPGVPNAFGLRGAEHNAIAPGKRPLSSMSPTIVTDSEGQPVLTVGAAGGPKIISQVLLTIVRHLDYGMSVSDAVAAPRFHHQWLPDSVLVESSAGDAWIQEMAGYGHQLITTDHSGVTQAVAIEDGRLVAVHDPRVPGKVGRAERQPIVASE